MGFLNRNHQWRRRRHFACHGNFCFLLIPLVNTACQHIGYQHVGGNVAVPAEFQHHIYPTVQIFENTIHGIGLRMGHQKR